jgi:hypothetical protein
MSPKSRRRTFISYSRTNKEFALKLALELRSSGFDIWLDQLDIPTGARWDDEVEQALEDCDIFMVILTPASSTSDNVKDEIGYAIDTGKRILPILLENAKVPLRLRRFQYVDFTGKNYDDGVESAKQLLRKLIEEAAIPVEQLHSVTEAQRAPTEIREREQEEVEQLAARKVESPISSNRYASPIPAVPERVSAPYPPVKDKGIIQSDKKTTFSRPLIFGIGIGMISVLVLGSILFTNLPTRSDPPDENEPAAIPVSGDPACPAESSQPVEIFVENPTALSLDYYWIDFDCQEQQYGTLEAYGSMSLETYVTHDWKFYNHHTGDLFFSYEADGEDYLQISGEVADPEVTGFTVGYVAFDGGEYNQIEEGLWLETSSTNGAGFSFEELERDEWSVYLYDPTRNVSIQLDLWTREIIYDDNTGNEPFVLYVITGADR